MGFLGKFCGKFIPSQSLAIHSFAGFFLKLVRDYLYIQIDDFQHEATLGKLIANDNKVNISNCEIMTKQICNIGQGISFYHRTRF